VQYLRLPRRVSFAYAADSGFVRTSGSTLLILGSGDVPEVYALRQLADYTTGRTSPFIAQPVTVKQSGVVVTAGAAVGEGQQLPGGLLAGQRHVDGGTAPVALSAPDGRTFVIRGDDFARLRGLDVLLHNELELADLGLRLRATAPEAALDLLPAARVRQVARIPKGPQSAGSRRAFADRHGTLTPTPDEAWSRFGVRAARWKTTKWPYAVRAILQPR
jgi:hypothetical protein